MTQEEKIKWFERIVEENGKVLIENYKMCRNSEVGYAISSPLLPIEMRRREGYVDMVNIDTEEVCASIPDDFLK